MQQQQKFQNYQSRVHVSGFGCNTYSYMRSHEADACLARLAELGFCEFEVMVHPRHLWPADMSADGRRQLRSRFERQGVQLTALNMPNIDLNVIAVAAEMRAYSLNLLSETVRLAGDLGARGVVIGPGKANPLFPAPAEELMPYFFAALDRLAPIAEQSGTALWVENMPFAFLPGITELLRAIDDYGREDIRVVYDVANAHFIGEDFNVGLKQCGERLALVHLSDTGQQAYRHDPVGLGTVPFANVPHTLSAIGYRARSMLEIISHDPDREIIDSVGRLAALGFKSNQHGNMASERAERMP
jgi:sugar phosphate isomerase/epimerase